MTDVYPAQKDNIAEAIREAHAEAANKSKEWKPLDFSSQEIKPAPKTQSQPLIELGHVARESTKY